MDPLTRGDPTSPLRWTCKSRAQLTAALTADGWRVSCRAVGRLLHALGYRLQAQRKTREGRQHSDRNAQFEHINATAASFLQQGQPVISVDTKKKELVGEVKTAGREWQPTQTPEHVQVHDFPTAASGRRSQPAHHRVSLPAGDEQVEQGRASALLSHHHQLARPRTPDLRNDRRPDRPHEHGDRIARDERSWTSAGIAPASSLCGGDARRRATSSRLSRRLELRDPSTHNSITQF